MWRSVFYPVEKRRVEGSKTMPDIADLEIGLYRWDNTHYAVDLRYEQRRAEGGGLGPGRLPTPIQFDLAKLRGFQLNPEEHGELLWTQLFADPVIQRTFDEALFQPGDLRIRLYISPYTPELHDLRWETLCDPRDHRWLVTRQTVRFARYLRSAGGGVVPPAPNDRTQLKAQIAIAAPSDLNRWPDARRLGEIEVGAERDLAVKALHELGIAGWDELSREKEKPVTLNNLIAGLENGCDILYLVCHGALIGQPILWLESEDGLAAVVTGTELTSRLRDLVRKPRLVILASCQSAGKGDGVPAVKDEGGTGALAALGPQLVAAGVPAVLAMQGNISVDTVRLFMPAFFRALHDANGLIDQAVAAARGALLNPPQDGKAPARPDWWAPVLFMGIKSGNLWEAIGTDPDAFQWGPVVSILRSGKCTAFLGSGMLDNLLGPTREIARRLAEAHRFPLAPEDGDVLPRVAQFLKVVGGDDYPFLELQSYLKRQLRDRYPDALRELGAGASLDDRIVRAGLESQKQGARPEVHDLLARMPFPLFVTTNPDTLLLHTLKKTVGPNGKLKAPHVRSFVPTRAAEGIDKPTVAAPLVYYLFRGFQDESVPVLKEDAYQDEPGPVLTEDDYFDYLLNIGNADMRKRIPSDVLRAMVNTSLVFLGFRLDEWDFRILAKSIRALSGDFLQGNHLHVAVQLAPGERFLDPESARNYLKQQFHFGQKSLSIYWGTVEQFLTELWDKYQRDLKENPD